MAQIQQKNAAQVIGLILARRRSGFQTAPPDSDGIHLHFLSLSSFPARRRLT